MSYQELESREYKVMLDPGQFGAADALPSAAAAFWASLQEALPRPSVLTTDGDVWRLSSPRAVTFWDTDEGWLYQHDFILRHRSEDNSGRVTLKKRSPDRVLASHNRIKKADGEDAGFNLERKFEEDIKLTDDDLMRSLFSHSLDWRDPPDFVDLSSNQIVERVFPGFRRALDVDDRRLRAVGGITMTEHVVELAEVELGGDQAEAAFVAWYRSGAARPSVVEFSYRYRGEERDFDPGVAADGLLVLTALAQLVSWRPQADRRITKTSWLYQAAGIV